MSISDEFRLIFLLGRFILDSPGPSLDLDQRESSVFL